MLPRRSPLPSPMLLALLALAALAMGCPSPGGLAPGSVNGLVMDLGTGAGLAGATVSGGGKTATTDSRGTFSLTGLSAGSVTLTVTKTGYAPAYATPRASADKPESTLVSMKAQGTPQSYSPTAAKTLSQATEAGPYAVTFVPNSLDTSDTNLKVSITPVDPTKERAALPGSLQTADTTILDPVTFAEFSIVDSSGNRVQLKSGQTATVELPIPPPLRDQYPLGAKIHCYAFNASGGAWDDFVDGTVRTSTVDGTTPVLAAAIKHFSWYGGAPEGNDCVDVAGRVVSAVDGRPLGNARVEASPGGYSYTDADGNFSLTAQNGATDFFAYQTGYDVSGDLTGIPGAKYIEFGRVNLTLSGLTTKPCRGNAVAGASPSGTLGSPSNPVQIQVGNLGKAMYEVTAILTGGDPKGQIVVSVETGLPKTDGSIDNPEPASGAKITISGSGGSQALVELVSGSGLYTLPAASTFAIQKGKTYHLDVDADGNGSIDGQGTASVVGDLALTNPTEGGSYAAAGLSAAWTDTGAGSPGYTAVYFLGITGTGSTTGLSFQTTSALTAVPFNLITGPGTPLPAGTYTATLSGYSGYASGASGNVTSSRNITGVGLSGTAYSVSAAPSVSFTLH